MRLSKYVKSMVTGQGPIVNSNWGMTSETKTWNTRPLVGKGMGHAEAHMHEDRTLKNNGFLAD